MKSTVQQSNSSTTQLPTTVFRPRGHGNGTKSTAANPFAYLALAIVLGLLLVPRMALATTITCGQTVANTTTNSSEIDVYSYAGTAGQVVTLAFSWGCYSGTGQVDIFYPGASSPSTNLLANCGGSVLKLTLPTTGSYTLWVHSQNFSGANGYQMTIQSITSPCNVTPVVCGQTVSSATSEVTETDVYSYAGTAGQVVTLAFSWGCYSGTGQLDIFYPGANSPSNSVTAGCGSSVIKLTLPSTGIYYLFVHEAGYNGANGYQITLQSITSPCNVTPVPCSQPVSSATSKVTETDVYNFNGAAGQTVLLIFSWGCYSGTGQLDIFYPGATSPSTNFLANCGSTSAYLTLPSTGDYTLFVHEAGYNGANSYSLEFECVGCSWFISPNSTSVGSSATNVTFNVTTPSGCNWTATNNVSWLTITGGSNGSGNGIVSYTVAANCNTARSGTITIFPLPLVGTNGWPFIVNQASPVVFPGGQDIGDPGAPGSWYYTNCGTYVVTGSGEGTDGSADVFDFLYLPWAGDGQIMARLQSLQGGDPSLAAAGVMIRQSLDPGSEQVSLSVNASTNMIFSRRLVTNDLSILNSLRGTNYLQGTNYIWLRLMRMGNTFVAHYSTNGLNWQYMWFTTVKMSNQVQVGLAVTAHHYGQLATAAFDNVSIGNLTNLGTWPLPEPVVLLGGQDWSPAEFQRVGGFEFLVGGVVGDYFSIKGSTNVATPLASWSQVATVTNTYGVVPFIDPQALTRPVRFYRAQRIGP